VDVAFDVRWLNHQPLVYICAHGLEGGDTLYGDDGIPMLTADQIRGARMPGSIVYLAGCFGIGELSSAFLAAGAAAVVGDRDVNWSGPIWPTGSNRLGQLLLGLLPRHPVGEALDLAKTYYLAEASGPRDHELVDSVTLVGNEAARLRSRT
jgi:hypothetical protein